MLFQKSVVEVNNNEKAIDQQQLNNRSTKKQRSIVKWSNEGEVR